ncbi:MAG: flagellar biosynthesis protein FlhB [Spirochaetaceae bacterium]|nr:flagellar biosynthesis protein FlhB [Spirochaetaceae bacterium]MCF7947118.1 flagellar biosynthesis protein FlhB [Spirochaetia bacterium]MCF7950119.1 flagellar biosynthesis protein FlhB [Spirochaetaceae bacterium]
MSSWYAAEEYYRFLAAREESRFNIHLQWFAAEDEGRTEEPTEQKIRKAREDGKVAKSSEFTSSLVLLFPIIGIGIMAPRMLATMEEMLAYFLQLSTQLDVSREAQIVPAFFSYYARLVAPPALIAFAAALLANLLQVGFLFSTKPITPDFSKIVPNFPRFLQKSFFSGEALFNFSKSIFKVIIIGIIAYINIRMELELIIQFVNAPYKYSFINLAGIAFRILVEAAIALLLLSLPDYLFQKKQHRESIKMTKQEVKEERKTMEGDPLVRSRLRERMRDMLNQNMMQNVPEADVVVTNPTHFAIGLEWKQERMNAPVVIAKGQDNIAQRIKEIARENEVPIIENKPLARALYSEVEIGDEIPEQYYEVMAIVLSEVYRMKAQEQVS